MTLSASPQSTALLLLDLQNEMVHPQGKVGAGGLAAIVESRGVLANAKRALDAARKRGNTVVHIRLGFRPDYSDCLSVAARITKLKQNQAAIVGTFGAEFADEVKPLDSEIVFTKQCVNPFFNSGLLSWLQSRGVTRVVLCGVATNLVVEASARAADDAGLAVAVLEDACASPNEEWHKFSVSNILPMFGEVTTSDRFAE